MLRYPRETALQDAL